jgi:hypothetical protein
MAFVRFQLAKAQFSKLMWCFGIDVFNEAYKVGVLAIVNCFLAILPNILPAYSIAVKYPDFITGMGNFENGIVGSRSGGL